MLIPILAGPTDAMVLLTRRSENLSSHPGELSYPGGRLEPADAGLVDAALREAEEEIGLPRDAVEVVGHLTDFETFYGATIATYVGMVDPGVQLQAPTTPGEVDEHLLLSLQALLDGAGPAPTAGSVPEPGDGGLGNPYPVMGYEGRFLPDEVRSGARLHYWHLDERSTLWGITGELTARLLRTGFDWEPPAKPRQVSELADLRP